MTHPFWNRHPGVRGDAELTFGERAADRMKQAFATWTALIGILVGMGLWLATGGFGADAKPYILLNLCLSCIAALQCFVLLIAARRSDQIAAELAQHDLDTDVAAKQLLDTLAADFAVLRQQHADQTAVLAAIQAALTVKTALPPRKGGAR